MLNAPMEIQKFFNKKVEKEYFFIVGKLNIDSDYFIEQIKKGIVEENNMNFKTNVQGFMTSWTYFNNEKKFLDILSKITEYVDRNLKFDRYELVSSWGLEMKKYQRTIFHNHYDHLWSGAIYLNSSKQNLFFPEIKQEVKPEPGTFCLFSGFLDHGCYKNADDNSKFAIAFNMKERNGL